MGIKLRVMEGLDNWWLDARGYKLEISKRSIYIKKLKLKVGDYVEVSIKKVKKCK